MKPGSKFAIQGCIKHAAASSNYYDRTFVKAEIDRIGEEDSAKFKQIEEYLNDGRLRAAFELIIANKSKAELERTITELERAAPSFYTGWNAEFQGETLSKLKKHIERCELLLESKHQKIYSNTIMLIGPLGVGKSRVVKELAREQFVVPVVLRGSDDTGYPPRDPEISKYMLELSEENITDRMECIVRAYSLVRGLIEEFRQWLSRSSDPSPEIFQKSIEPSCTMVEPDEDEDCYVELPAKYLARYRSKTRANFSESACRRAIEYKRDLDSTVGIKDQWETSREWHIRVEEEIRRMLRSTIESLQNQKEWKDNTRLYIFFDEIGALSTNDVDERNYGLSWVFRFISSYNIWAIFAGRGIPGNSHSTGRYYRRSFEPFLSFDFDLGMKELMSKKSTRAVELSKSLKELASPKHYIRMGRPLWNTLSQRNDMAIVEYAAQCLFNAPIGTPLEHCMDSTNFSHSFAAWSSILCLDPDMETVEAVSLMEKAVSSHLRVPVVWNSDLGLRKTRTASEPIVALAALLCLERGSNIGVSFRRTFKMLFGKGLVDKGEKGELLAKLVFALAIVKGRTYDGMNRPDQKLYEAGLTVKHFLENLLNLDGYDKGVKNFWDTGKHQQPHGKGLAETFGNAYICGFFAARTENTHSLDPELNIQFCTGSHTQVAIYSSQTTRKTS